MDLIGRDAERAVLDAAIAATSIGHGRAIVVTGPAGIGKSALLASMFPDPRVDSVQVNLRSHGLSSPGHELEVAFGLATATMPRSVAVPEVGRADGSAAIAMVVGRLVAAVEARAAERPLALVVDGAEAVDRATVELALELAGRVGEIPLLLVYATRSAGAATFADFEQLDLAPLDAADVLALAQSWRTSIRADEAERLSAAEGNPLHLSLLVSADPDEPIAATLHDAIRSRLSGLDDVAIDIVQLAAILGPEASLADVAALRGGGLAEALLAVERIRDRDLLVASSDELRFPHDAVREVVARDTPTSLARTLHLQTVRTLSNLTLYDRARHLVAAARPGDRWIAESLRDVAVELGITDPDRALELLTMAIDVAGSSARELEIEPELVVALARVARVDDALALARVVLERSANPVTQARMRAVLGQGLIMRGDSSVEALAHLEAASEAFATSPRARALLLGDAAVAKLLAGDFDGAAMTAASVKALAPELEHPAPLCDAYCVDALLSSFRGDFARAMDFARQAVAVVGDDLEVRRRSVPEYFMTFVAVNGRYFDEATRVCAEGRNALDAAGAIWAIPLLHFAAANNAYHQGDWDHALAEIESGHALAASIKSVLGISFGHAIAALIFEARGDLARARSALDAAEGLARVDTQGADLDTLVIARARLDRCDGAAHLGVQALREAWAFDRIMGLLDDLPDLAVELSHTAIDANDHEALAWVVAELDEVLPNLPSANGAAEWCRALCDDDLVGLGRARAILEQADRRPHMLGLICGDEALAAARAGDSDAASVALDRAIGYFDGLQSIRWTTRLLASARNVGIVRRRRSSHSTRSVGWEALTATEVDVVRLAVEGLTNRGIGERLFISHRTVETHIKHVFAKLDVKSRVDLVAASVGRF